MKNKFSFIMVLLCVLSLITIGLFGYAAIRKKQVSESEKRIFEASVWSDDSSEDEESFENISGGDAQEEVETENGETEEPDRQMEVGKLTGQDGQTETGEMKEQGEKKEENGKAPKDDKKKNQKKSNGKKVAIDAGHQLRGDNGLEPVGPGASEKKAKVSSGTSGVSTGVPEYQLNLEIAKRLKRELKKRGYQVFMIRSKNEVTLSNVERAQMANESGSDIYIRLHADGVDNVSTHGASALYPSANNPYVGNLSAASKKLSELVLNAYCKKTGISNRGLSVRDDLTGTNWSEIPVTLLEMGFMSNPAEDEKMQQDSVQALMAEGIADGVDAYFQEK